MFGHRGGDRFFGRGRVVFATCFLIAELRRFHKQHFPMARDGRLGRLAVGLQPELAVLEIEQVIERGLTAQHPGPGVNDAAVADDDLAGLALGKHLEHGGIAAQTFELEDVLQLHVVHHAAEPLLARQVDQLVERQEQGLKTLGRGRLFEENFHVLIGEGQPRRLVGVAGQHHHRDVRETRPRHAHKLHPAHHRHPAIDHEQIKIVFLERGQGAGRVVGADDIPVSLAGLRHQFADEEQERGIIVHEKHSLLTRRDAAHGVPFASARRASSAVARACKGATLTSSRPRRIERPVSGSMANSNCTTFFSSSTAQSAVSEISAV